jgi:hypothetical protein
MPVTRGPPSAPCRDCEFDLFWIDKFEGDALIGVVKDSLVRGVCSASHVEDDLRAAETEKLGKRRYKAEKTR